MHAVTAVTLIMFLKTSKNVKLNDSIDNYKKCEVFLILISHWQINRFICLEYIWKFVNSFTLNFIKKYSLNSRNISKAKFETFVFKES